MQRRWAQRILMGLGMTVFLARSLAALEPSATDGETVPSQPKPWQNGLGMKFRPVAETPRLLWCAWETRVSDYKVFVGETKRSWPAVDFKQGPDHPAVMISWEDAKAFCAWLTRKELASGKITMGMRYRLPTDLEWSLAAGFPEGKPEAGSQEQILFPWGLDWPPPVGAGNYSPEVGVDRFPYTAPVGSFSPAANGLFDLGGNVWEWCEDMYNQTADFRVLRGASWRMHNPGDLLVSCRVGNRPALHLNGYGFRVVLEFKAEPEVKPIPPPVPQP
jgi:eukaryotic-like serine/threonine-protein kinase